MSGPSAGPHHHPDARRRRPRHPGGRGHRARAFRTTTRPSCSSRSSRPSRSVRAPGSASRSATASSTRSAGTSATVAPPPAARSSISILPAASVRPVTNRLYYTEPSCRRFDATVTRAFEHEGRPAVTLDRTAFYPSSGGQPFDTGRLGGDRGRRNHRRRRRRHPRAGVAAAAGAPVDRRNRLGAPVRSHAAAHRPAHAVRRVRNAVRQPDGRLPHGRGGVDDRPGARRIAGGDRARRRRGQSHRLGGSAGRDPLRIEGGGGQPVAQEGAAARGHAPADRHLRLRSVARAAARTSIEPARSG